MFDTTEPDTIHYDSVKTLIKKEYSGLHSWEPHCCTLCKKICSSRYTLKNHLETCHFKTKKFFCDLCPYVCFTKKYINFHMRTHRKKSFSCNVCEYKTAFKHSLRDHKLTHSAAVKCPVCNKQVKSLYFHMRTHDPKKLCPICQKPNSQMSVHLRTHRIEKCDICQETFENKEELRRWAVNLWKFIFIFFFISGIKWECINTEKSSNAIVDQSSIQKGRSDPTKKFTPTTNGLVKFVKNTTHLYGI